MMGKTSATITVQNIIITGIFFFIELPTLIITEFSWESDHHDIKKHVGMREPCVPKPPKQKRRRIFGPKPENTVDFMLVYRRHTTLGRGRAITPLPSRF